MNWHFICHCLGITQLFKSIHMGASVIEALWGSSARRFTTALAFAILFTGFGYSMGSSGTSEARLYTQQAGFSAGSYNSTLAQSKKKPKKLRKKNKGKNQKKYKNNRAKNRTQKRQGNNKRKKSNKGRKKGNRR